MVVSLLLSIFTLQTICSLVPCGPNFGDPVPASEQYFQSVHQGSGGGGGGFKRDLSNSLEIVNESEEPLTELKDAYDGIFPIVWTPNGGLRGIPMRTVKGRPLKAFMSIPYAEPPTGNLRFRSPVPKSPWVGLRDAQKHMPACEQLDGTQFFRVFGQEDCLFLSVFTPIIRDGRKLPIMVFIHGGAFFFGQGNFGPAYLLDKDVILVSIQYRLGPLGFLATGDAAAPGNFGLKDQRLAINWVYENIEYFGGNKSQITLVGQSAGAVSAHLHTMSAPTKDLIQGAILHSGSAFEFWAVRDITPILTLRLADSLRCPIDNSTLMVDCLRTKPSALIVARQFRLWDFWYFPGVLMGPVIEPDFIPDAFMTQTPMDLYAQGQVARIPIIGGIVQDEGDLFGIVIEHTLGMRGTFNRKWNEVAPYAFDLPITNEREVNAELASKVREFYLGDKPFNYYTRKAVHDAFGDRHIVTGAHKALQFHSAYGAPTFGFLFNFRGRIGLANSFGYDQFEWGVSHCDDLLYFVNSSAWFRPLSVQDPEFTVAEFLINIWSNFIIKGKPVFSELDGTDVDFWTPIRDPKNMPFLEINSNPRIISEPFMERIRFWEHLNLTEFPEDPTQVFKNTENKTLSS